MKIIFAGTPEFALPTLEALLKSAHKVCAVYTKPDRPVGRGQKTTPTPVKEYALEKNLTIYQPETLRDPAVQQSMRELGADVLVDVAYGMILPVEVLDIPRLGCINLHPSLLPRWRGAAPIPRAILAGDERTGVSIIKMDVGLDTGAIIKQHEIAIAETDTSATLLPKLSQLGAQMILSVLDELESNKAPYAAQNDAQSLYAEKISKEEAKIHWHKSAIEIDRMIRAFNPWPIVFSNIAGKSIRIWEARVLEAEVEAGEKAPGTIVQANKHGLDVITGEGILRITKLQLPGGRVLPVSDILNAHVAMFSIGHRFE